MLIADIDGPAAARTAAAIRDEGGRAEPAECDVADSASVDAAIAQALSSFGTLDVLVNNANLGFTDLLDAADTPPAARPLVRVTAAARVSVRTRASAKPLVRVTAPREATAAEGECWLHSAVRVTVAASMSRTHLCGRPARWA